MPPSPTSETSPSIARLLTACGFTETTTPTGRTPSEPEPIDWPIRPYGRSPVEDITDRVALVAGIDFGHLEMTVLAHMAAQSGKLVVLDSVVVQPTEMAPGDIAARVMDLYGADLFERERGPLRAEELTSIVLKREREPEPVDCRPYLETPRTAPRSIRETMRAQRGGRGHKRGKGKRR